MMRGDSCHGFVGFDSVLTERTYSSYERQVLGDFSNALLGAVERHRIEEQREVIYQELIVAKREAEQANIAKSEFLFKYES
ncbi:multi-sensor hybrid histidine kinase domain protein [Exiguobacterium sp. S17]|nr:multi-sensor hybrid histidine kinase domain protein [Exiguobacterium sp. S17]